ncbi:Codanin-1 [Nymphon striatum]|nr:Codanin-1 [Nymphon striatum]
MLFIYRKTAIPKRIKPTLITASNDVSPTSASSVSPFKSSGKKEIVLNATKSDDSSFADAFSVTKSGESICNFSEERELLNPVKSKPISNELKDWNVVCPEEVTFMAELQLLAELYSSLISNNLVPNISVELYFILQLLTLKFQAGLSISKFNTDEEEINYFSSVHNCVFFSVYVIEDQIQLFKFLDIALLRILVNIHRIETFSCNLKVQLNQMCLSDKQSLFYSVSDKSNVSGVSFQVDTDNKSNFATNVAFQTFRKQRDMFYEIIRDWERNHLTCGWSMTENLGSKIKKAMCKGQRTAENKGQEEDFLALTNLMKSHPEKMKKLQERFIKPNHVGGPCPPPSFPGCQEFFKDFILILESPYFIQHLSNHLVSRIHELNQVEFDIPDYDQGTSNGLEMSVAYEVQEQYYTCLHDLKLLGKLLGFIIFLPYRTKEKLSEFGCLSYLFSVDRLSPFLPYTSLLMNKTSSDGRASLCSSFNSGLNHTKDSNNGSFCFLALSISYSHSKMQTYAAQPIDILNVLNEAIVKQRKILVIPWIVEFLSELRILVSEFSAGISSQSEKVRKITPITNLNNGNAAKQEVQLQADLQYYFFSHKSPHLKKSVDFVSDRLASNALWHIRQKIIPEIYSWCTNFLKIMVDEFEDDESQDFKKIQSLTDDEKNLTTTSYN